MSKIRDWAEFYLGRDLFVAVALALGLTALLWFWPPSGTYLGPLLKDMAYISAALFGVILAGFAIFASLMEPAFARVLFTNGALAEVVRFFGTTAKISLTSAVMTFAGHIVLSSSLIWGDDLSLARSGLFAFCSFFFFWAVTSAYYLIDMAAFTVLKRGMFHAAKDIRDAQREAEKVRDDLESAG